MRIRTVFDDFWTQIWPFWSQISNRPFSELRKSWEHRFGQLTNLEPIFWNFRKSYVDFHGFWSFLVFNFEETVLEAQKELSLWIGPPESSLFIFLKKMGNLTWNSLIFTFTDLKLRRNRSRSSERVDRTDFIHGNVCIDTFFKKNQRKNYTFWSKSGCNSGKSHTTMYISLSF